MHEALMVLLNSNFAAVAATSDWVRAMEAGTPLPKSDLGSSAMQGQAAFMPVA